MRLAKLYSALAFPLERSNRFSWFSYNNSSNIVRNQHFKENTWSCRKWREWAFCLGTILVVGWRLASACYFLKNSWYWCKETQNGTVRNKTGFLGEIVIEVSLTNGERRRERAPIPQHKIRIFKTRKTRKNWTEPAILDPSLVHTTVVRTVHPPHRNSGQVRWLGATGPLLKVMSQCWYTLARNHLHFWCSLRLSATATRITGTAQTKQEIKIIVLSHQPPCRMKK